MIDFASQTIRQSSLKSRQLSKWQGCSARQLMLQLFNATVASVIACLRLKRSFSHTRSFYASVQDHRLRDELLKNCAKEKFITRRKKEVKSWPEISRRELCISSRLNSKSITILLHSAFFIVRCIRISVAYIACSFLSFWDDLATTSKVTHRAYENRTVHTYCFTTGFL